MSVAEVFDFYDKAGFEWGVTDCCTFVRDCLQHNGAETPDVFWTDQNEAAALLDAFGGLEEAITEFYGDPITEEPQDGDIAMVESGGRSCLGYVVETMNGLRVALITERGITDWPVAFGVAFWRP